MKKQFIPQKESELVLWLQNLVTEIRVIGPALNMTPEDVKKMQDLALLIMSKIASTSAADTEFQKIRADKNTTKEDGLVFIISTILHLMTHAGWTPAYAKALRTDFSKTVPDYTNIKPSASARITGAEIVLRIVKRGLPGYNVYTKLQSDAGWTKLDHGSRGSYTDKRPLAVRGVPEIRQYMIMFVLGDKEVGLPSDIITVLFGG